MRILITCECANQSPIASLVIAKWRIVSSRSAGTNHGVPVTVVRIWTAKAYLLHHCVCSISKWLLVRKISSAGLKHSGVERRRPACPDTRRESELAFVLKLESVCASTAGCAMRLWRTRPDLRQSAIRQLIGSEHGPAIFRRPKYFLLLECFEMSCFNEP